MTLTRDDMLNRVEVYIGKTPGEQEGDWRKVVFNGKELAECRRTDDQKETLIVETLYEETDGRLVVRVCRTTSMDHKTCSLIEVSPYELKTGAKFKELAREAQYHRKPFDLDEALEHCKGAE